MLECIHSGKHPSIIGPVLIRQKVDFSFFNYFASTLDSHDCYLSVLMAFVTQYWKTSFIAALLILRYSCVKSPQVYLAKNDFLL